MAKEIPLFGKYGNGKLALVDDEDYPKVAGYRWYLSVGGYVVYSPNNRSKLYLHKLILDGAPEVDHINGARLDSDQQPINRTPKSSENRRNVFLLHGGELAQRPKKVVGTNQESAFGILQTSGGRGDGL